MTNFLLCVLIWLIATWDKDEEPYEMVFGATFWGTISFGFLKGLFAIPEIIHYWVIK